MAFLRNRLPAEQYIEGLLRSDRVVLAQAITLIESSLPSDSLIASEVLSGIISKTGNSVRIGITGVPGAGKSTLIEAFGTFLADAGKKVAVLAVDPSSRISKGSILGDKTRMNKLSFNSRAFIRPLPSGDSAGGVSWKTKEAILLCEAAGFDVIIVETVGVGQSEMRVKELTDFFLLVMLTGSGDELQSMKSGIIEMADGIVVNKGDGANKKQAEVYRNELQHSLHIFKGRDIPVLTVSALENGGIEELWASLSEVLDNEKRSGNFVRKRQEQDTEWMNSCFMQMLLTYLKENKSFSNQLLITRKMVREGALSPYEAAKNLFKIFREMDKGM